jgi:ribosome recycling factor
MDESIFIGGSKKMNGVIELLSEDLMKVQTGRAKPSLVESIKVEAYSGSFMEIKELASITSPDPQSILIKPWDSSVVKAVEKAIIKSDLQVQPIVSDDQVRIQIPSLTEERRMELVKVVKQKVESGKAMVRQVRLEMKKDIDKLKDDDGVSEDDIHGMYDRLQKQVDEYNKKLDEMEEVKEKELLSL